MLDHALGHVALSGMLGHPNLWGFSPNIVITITNDNEPVTATKRHVLLLNDMFATA